MCRKLIYLICLVSMLSLATNISADLIAHLSFDEGAGTTASDITGNGYDGTLTGMDWEASGKYGACLKGPGGDPLANFVELAKSTEIPMRDADLTVTMWFKSASTAKQTLVTKVRSDGAHASGAGSFAIGINREASATYAGEIGLDIGWYAFSRMDDSKPINDDVWHHFAAVMTNADTVGQWAWQVYVDGQLDSQTWNVNTSLSPDEMLQNVVRFGGGVATANYFGGAFEGLIDDIRIFDTALTAEEVAETMNELVMGKASSPSPASDETDVQRDGLILSWRSGNQAKEHDVYVGKDLDALVAATTTSPEYKGRQSETTYELDRLELDKTYYWRIDEVNDANPDGPWIGEVWSFEVEPVGYPVPVDLITATASSMANEDQGPGNVNGIGLEDGKHLKDMEYMWLSADSEPNQAWIQLDLEEVVKLSGMHVWNHNLDAENILGFGIKDALIEYSRDGASWSEFGTIELAQASGNDDYEGIEIALDSIVAKSIKITAISNWSILGLKKYGLSEVRLLALPVKARELQPADGATDLDPAAVLTWRAGRLAGSHDVILSTDQQAVIDGTVPAVNVTEAGYAWDLDLDATYYWRVDEVNEIEDPPVWTGNMQSFSTEPYMTVDDMESYSVEVGEEFFATWADGYEKPANGALVGHGFYAEPETQTVHDGAQSMPLYYGKDGASVSETTRLFAPAEDWSLHGIMAMSLQFYGDPANTTGQMYIKINGTKVDTYMNPADMKQTQWHPWTFDLPAGLTSVENMTIGIEGGEGIIYVDTIRLYPLASEIITPVMPSDNPRVHLPFEEGAGTTANDISGNGSNGTLVGTAVGWSTAGKIGGCLSGTGGSPLDSGGVEIANSDSIVFAGADVTVALWFKTSATGTMFFSKYNPTDEDTHSEGDITLGIRDGYDVVGVDQGWVGFSAGNKPVTDDEWHHTALVFLTPDLNAPTANIWKLYVDGSMEVQVSRNDENADDGVAYPLAIGGVGGNVDFFPNALSGLLDEVRIYERELSAAEVAGLAGRTAPLYKPF